MRRLRRCSDNVGNDDDDDDDSVDIDVGDDGDIALLKGPLDMVRVWRAVIAASPRNKALSETKHRADQHIVTAR